MSDTIFEKQGSTLIVKPRGRLDLVSSPTLEKDLKEHMDGVQEIIMDFTDVEYLSSGGLRVLLSTEQQLENNGGNMTVIHANDYILEVFELVGFMDVIKVIKD